MRTFLSSWPVRSRLLVAAALVQAAMLAVLIAAGASPLLIAVAAIVLSLVCMAALSRWLTRLLEARILELADSEAKFTAIADYSYDCECWIEPEGKLIWINPRVFDMFGYSPAEALDMQHFPAPFISE